MFQRKKEKKKQKNDGIGANFQRKIRSDWFSKTVIGSPVRSVQDCLIRCLRFFFRFCRLAVSSYCLDRYKSRFTVQPVRPFGPVLTILLIILIITYPIILFIFLLWVSNLHHYYYLELSCYRNIGPHWNYRK
jgi:hypothetical protein